LKGKIKLWGGHLRGVTQRERTKNKRVVFFSGGCEEKGTLRRKQTSDRVLA